MTAKAATFIHRHEKLTLVLVNAALLCVLLAAGEVFARISTTYQIDYYTDPKVMQGNMARFPWGVLPVNSLGYYDEEFNLASDKPRVGWFGDSVDMGLGAGFPYRVSDIVRAKFGQLENWNLAGNFGGEFDGARLEANSQKLRLDTAVYVLNLNDIVPSIQSESASRFFLYHALHTIVRGHLDYLRDRSYLYNYLRTSVKNLLQRMGFEASGYFAYELWPHKSDDVFRQFADRVNTTFRNLRAKGVKMCVIIPPYEMQVSADAARTYSDLGFRWEDGFTEGSAQKLVRQYLDKDLPVYDALDAFADKSAKVGHYFVYNEGDKIDWNHPNRAGHAAIARGFMQSRSCPAFASN